METELIFEHATVVCAISSSPAKEVDLEKVVVKLTLSLKQGAEAALPPILRGGFPE